MALCAGGVVHAQDRTGTPYMIGGLGFPYQQGPSGETPGQTYVSAPGGTTVGWVAAAGLFIRSGVGIEGEVASTGTMRAREPSRYDQTFNEERRDRFFGANVRLRILRGSHVDVEPLFGVFVAQHQASRQTDTLTFQGQLLSGPRMALDLPVTAAFQAGVDVRTGGRRFGVVPSFRIRYSGAGADAFDDQYARTGWVSSTYPGGGFSRWTIAPGIAGRVDF
jgi:hypothetical protein